MDIFNPQHNAREIAKQLILLEDHIIQPPKNCPDCIRKHMLCAEALAEEAVTLDPTPENQAVFGSAAREIRDVARSFLDGEDRGVLHRRIRGLRKKLSKSGFDSVQQRDRKSAVMGSVASAPVASSNPYPLVEGWAVIVWLGNAWWPAQLVAVGEDVAL